MAAVVVDRPTSAPFALKDHQLEGIAWFTTHPRGLLADEPGLGKSAQALFAASSPVLIVAPAMILDAGVWRDEIEKWAPHLDVTAVAYTSLCEREKTAGGGSRPTNMLRSDLDRVWGTVIFDESHYLKGRKTKWTVAAKKIRSDRVYQLTGTPIANWAQEAFVSLQLCYPGDERFTSYWRWAREWFVVAPTKWSPMAVGDFLSEDHARRFREENWGSRILMRTRDECLDLPPLTQQRWNVKMTPPQARVYRQLKKDFIAWLDSGEEVVAWNSAAQMVKLCQCATGLEALTEGEESGSGKLDALRSILKDRELPTLVVGHFRNSVDACADVAVDVGKRVCRINGSTSKADRESIVRWFQNGEVDVLCATIQTIGEGLTLHAADQVVFVERSWRPSLNEQAMRRIHRIGQERPVTSIDLVTQGTVDERVLAVLAAKTDQQMKALGRDQLRTLA